MKVEIKSKKGLRTILSVVIDKKSIQKKMDEKLNELQKEVALKGFRPGKVPPTVIKSQFGKSIYGEVVDKILRETSSKAIDEKKLNAILNALEIEINSVSESGIGMTIPRYRVDVTRPADVIEEILRIYGYNKILDVPLKYEASPAYQWKSLHKLELKALQDE